LDTPFDVAVDLAMMACVSVSAMQMSEVKWMATVSHCARTAALASHAAHQFSAKAIARVRHW
jgi:hypothetical protein